MSELDQPSQSQFTSEELIQNFIDAEYDLAEMESFFTELVLHFIYPTDDWKLGPRRTMEVLDKSYIFLDLLRGIRLKA
jgi:hypothetical protein